MFAVLGFGLEALAIGGCPLTQSGKQRLPVPPFVSSEESKPRV